MLIGAIVVWSASYALTITNYPPTQTVGPLTTTHVAAGWPACLAMAALSEGARQRGRWWSRLMAGLILVWLACMVGYHHYLQREYIRAWHLQKNFWRQVMALAPEAGLGWTVIVDGTPGQGSPVMWSNSWADYLVYRLIFTTAFDPRGPAFAHLGYLGGLIQFRLANDQVEWRPQFWGGPFVPIDPGAASPSCRRPGSAPARTRNLHTSREAGIDGGPACGAAHRLALDSGVATALSRPFPHDAVHPVPFSGPPVRGSLAR